MKTKFMHIKKWLKEAYDKKVYAGWFDGTVELVRPHEAYSEIDLKELVKELRH